MYTPVDAQAQIRVCALRLSFTPLAHIRGNYLPTRRILENEGRVDSRQSSGRWHRRYRLYGPISRGAVKDS